MTNLKILRYFNFQLTFFIIILIIVIYYFSLSKSFVIIIFNYFNFRQILIKNSIIFNYRSFILKSFFNYFDFCSIFF